MLPATYVTLLLQWQVLLEHREDTRLESVEVAENYLTVFARSNGLQVPSLLSYEHEPGAEMPRSFTVEGTES